MNSDEGGSFAPTRCLACQAQRAYENASRVERAAGVSPPPDAFAYAWLLGCAEGIRTSSAGTGVLLCSEHAVDMTDIRKAVGLPPPRVDVLIVSEDAGTPDATLNVLLTDEEFFRIRARMHAAGRGYDGLGQAAAEELGREVAARFRGENVCFTRCERLPPEGRFRVLREKPS